VSFSLIGKQLDCIQEGRLSLAGRATLLELWPLALAERVESQQVTPSGLDSIWREGEPALQRMVKAAPTTEAARLWRGLAEEQLVWGGYPGLEPLRNEERMTWLRDFRRTYLERDLADLGRVADLDQFALAQNLLAARSAQLLSYSEVSRELGVAVNTVKRYLRFLEISYQVFLLRPLLPTVTARLVKSPKLYWTDPGLARLLSERMGGADGPIFETFVLDELLRWSSWQVVPPQLHFYRTSGGQEIDFVLHSAQCLLAIEAKAGRSVHRKNARPLLELLRNVRVPGLSQHARRLGLVATRGREVEPLAPHVWAIPDWRLFGPAA